MTKELCRCSTAIHFKLCLVLYVRAKSRNVPIRSMCRTKHRSVHAKCMADRLFACQDLFLCLRSHRQQQTKTLHTMYLCFGSSNFFFTSFSLFSNFFFFFSPFALFVPFTTAYVSLAIRFHTQAREKSETK